MSLLQTQTNKESVPEWEKSLFSWGGQGKGKKQYTPSPPQVKIEVIKIARAKVQMVPARAPGRDTSSSPGKRAAPVSISSISSLSSLSSLSSESGADDLDMRVSKKPKLSNNSFASTKSGQQSQDASQARKITKDASLPSRHVKAIKDVSQCINSSEPDEDVFSAALPSMCAKKMKESLTPATMSTSTSAGSSRASSVQPEGRSLKTKKPSRKADPATGKVRRRKKRLLSDLTLPPKKGTYQGLAPVMVRGSSASRSTTAFESDNNLPPPKPRLQRVTWTEEDGLVVGKLRSSEEVVRRLTEAGRYVTFFRNLNDPDDISFELSEFPTVELEYPNTGAKETFLLARPKDKDHYDPTLDIEDTLRTLVKDIIPSEHRDLLGPLPEEVLMNIADDDDDDDGAGDDTRTSSAPHDFSSQQNYLSSPSRAPSTPYSDCMSSPPLASSLRSSPAPRGLMKTLIRARRREDGPTYRATLQEINKCILKLTEHASGNILKKVPHTWSMSGIPQGVVLRIIEETYQRCVGPRINQLKKYEAFSSNVYGELTPAFVNDIIERTGLRSDSLFMDLGSGVGNVVLQTALQTGCKAFGIEERDDTARIADDQLEQMRLRCRMWGVSIGDVELVQGDMTASPRVDELMSKADVVLVNNYVFSEELNAALRPKFLDLKEGAYVVSLKPFAPPNNQMLTERNFDDLSAIFDVYPFPYHSGTVSWSGGYGMYYIHHVNREGYRKNREAFESLHMRARRGGRR